MGLNWKESIRESIDNWVIRSKFILFIIGYYSNNEVCNMFTRWKFETVIIIVFRIYDRCWSKSTRILVLSGVCRCNNLIVVLTDYSTRFEFCNLHFENNSFSYFSSVVDRCKRYWFLMIIRQYKIRCRLSHSCENT